MWNKILGIALLIIALLAISWGLTSFIIWLICLCFGLEFKLLTATGIWLVLCLLSSVFGKKKEVKV